jgi:hypothetical protein
MVLLSRKLAQPLYYAKLMRAITKMTIDKDIFAITHKKYIYLKGEWLLHSDQPSVVIIYKNNMKHGEWYWLGKIHRDNDLPALITTYSEGKCDKQWYKHGVLHRDGGPALTYEDTFVNIYEWYQNGVYHREDGPAIESNGNKQWYRNGMRHREDGPAIEDSDGYKWYLNGKKHRIGGPAVEYNGEKEWWVNGIMKIPISEN